MRQQVDQRARLDEKAKAARNAFHSARGATDARYPWESLHEETREAWRAAVIAVLGAEE